MANVQEFNDPAALMDLGPDWDRLMAETPQAGFFQSWRWLAAWWRHVSPDRKLRLLVVNENGRPIGILPLNVTREATAIGQRRLLTTPIDGWGSFYNPIGRPFSRIMREALQHVTTSRPDFDVAELRSLRLPESAWGETAPTTEEIGSPQSSAPPARTSFDGLPFQGFKNVALIRLPGDWEEYWESRRVDSNRRRNVERCERRLLEQGSLTYVRYRPAGEAHGDADPKWHLYDACEQLASRSWQAHLVDGNTMSHANVRDFLRDAHVAAVQAGALDLNLLYLNGQPIAFVYGYHYRGYCDLMRIGFDPDMAKLAPGNALWTRMIRDSIERRDHTFDLGPTCLDYKRFWMTSVEPSFSLVQYRAVPQSQAIRLARWVRQRWPRRKDDSNANSKRQAGAAAVAANEQLTV